jgi:hypothetical protein
MNRNWTESQALKRGNETFGDSAMTAITFKTKLSAPRTFIQRYEILGRVSAFVWRAEYQKRGLRHAHILFWADIDTQDIHAIESVINVRHPKDSPFIEDKGMVSDSRQLIDSYQIHHHIKRCRSLDWKSPCGYSQAPSQRTSIRGHSYYFARDARETNIVRHNPFPLAYLRGHHSLKLFTQNSALYVSSNIVRRIPMPAAYPSKMFLVRPTQSLFKSRCSIMLQLGFRLRRNALLAFVDIGAIM